MKQIKDGNIAYGFYIFNIIIAKRDLKKHVNHNDWKFIGLLKTAKICEYHKSLVNYSQKQKCHKVEGFKPEMNHFKQNFVCEL